MAKAAPFDAEIVAYISAGPPPTLDLSTDCFPLATAMHGQKCVVAGQPVQAFHASHFPLAHPGQGRFCLSTPTMSLDACRASLIPMPPMLPPCFESFDSIEGVEPGAAKRILTALAPKLALEVRSVW